MLSGEIDFILKCVAPDLAELPVLRHRRADRGCRDVESVRTSLVIRRLKNDRPCRTLTRHRTDG